MKKNELNNYNDKKNLNNKYLIMIKKIQNWIRNKVKKANASGVVLGISGGIDSSTLAIISYQVFKKDAHFYYLKTKVDDINEMHIKKLNLVVENKIETIDLTKEFNDFSDKFNLKEDWIKANTKSRYFMNVLYTKAQQNNSLVLGTDNFDEYYLGYFTKWGDGGCDLLPFANIFKSDIYEMAKLLNAPTEILDKRPSANLLNDQYDEDELGFSYDDFEKYIMDNTLISSDISTKIEYFHKKTSHKRKLIPRGPKFK
ncbi:NAD(+) synthase [Mycoplasma sp. 125]|uniref:NAD(+) synthase n=1 Tax=Mycoplasma sp. 125 TaxID=3447505 RepID=UPI003F65A250